MDSEQVEVYLQKLKRYVYDESQIVTLLWLCKTLKLHPKDASNLLDQFVKDATSPNSAWEPIGVHYVLSGVMEQNGELRSKIVIANDAELEKMRKLFKKVASQGIYSVQRGKAAAMSCIGLVDFFQWHGENGTLLGCEVSPNCTQRSNLRTSRVLPSVTRIASTDKSKASHLFGKTTSNNDVKPEHAVKQAAVSDKKENTVQTQPKVDANKKLVKQSSNEKNKTNNIANMFAKAPPPKSKNEVKSKEIKVAETVVKKEANNSLYDSGTDEEANRKEEENRKKQKTAKKMTRKRQRKDQSSDRPEKKRKRIVEVDDSDDDMFASDDDSKKENVIESEEESPIQIVPTVLPPKNKNRKWMEKTYEDDEGYMVTKKELVVDSSQEDNDEDVVMESPKNAELHVSNTNMSKNVKKMNSSEKIAEKKGKKNQPAKPSNQPTLMNFFSKK